MKLTLIIALMTIPSILLFVAVWWLNSTRWGKLIPLPWSPVLLHSIIIIIFIGLYPTGWFIPGVPFDDAYLPCYCIPGLHIYWPSALASHLFWPWLVSHLEHKAASIISIIVLPGIAGMVIGGIQWLLIGFVMKKMKSANNGFQRIA